MVLMQRRNFVRLIGDGAIYAATVPLAACSSGMPDDAVAAWRGPVDEPDLRRWALSYAILAPHSHNLQSWQIELPPGGDIVLRCDPARLLPETDPYARQIMMSHGTFLELLAMAARERGHRAEIVLFPEGPFAPERVDARPVARIRLVPDAQAARDPLFAQVLRRRTNRNVYDADRPVPATAWHAMAEAVRPYPLHFGRIGPDEPAALQRQRDVAREAWRTELVTPRTMMESIRVLRVGSAEISTHRDGISITDPMVVLLDRVGLFDRSRAPAPDSMATRRQIDDFDRSIASTQNFLWMVSDGNDRVTQVNAGRAYARVQLAATAAGAVMQPLQQALQEYPEQAAAYAAIHDLLGARRPAQTVQMWARVGHAEPVGPAPRRGLPAQLVSA
jgi:hypothetical protein